MPKIPSRFIIKQKNEKLRVRQLFKQLCDEKKHYFPCKREKLKASKKHGVYVIFDGKGRVLHVGRTHRAAGGLNQRLRNHLGGQSSFVYTFLEKNKDRLRRRGKFQYTYKYLEVRPARHRALLEHYATGVLCPAHLGLGLNAE